MRPSFGSGVHDYAHSTARGLTFATRRAVGASMRLFLFAPSTCTEARACRCVITAAGPPGGTRPSTLAALSRAAAPPRSSMLSATTMSFSVGAPARLQVEARRRFKGTMLNTKRRPIKVRRLGTSRACFAFRFEAARALRHARLRFCALVGAQAALHSFGDARRAPGTRQRRGLARALRQRGAACLACAAASAALTLARRPTVHQPAVAAPPTAGLGSRRDRRGALDAALRMRRLGLRVRARPAADVVCRPLTLPLAPQHTPSDKNRKPVVYPVPSEAPPPVYRVVG